MDKDIMISGISLILIFFALFVLPHFFARKKFKCLRCGKCCRLKVKLSEKDIKMISDSGNKNFIESGNYMKRINGYCMFLTLKNGVTSCGIESIKPEICRGWPLQKGLFGKKIDIRCSSIK